MQQPSLPCRDLVKARRISRHIQAARNEAEMLPEVQHFLEVALTALADAVAAELNDH